MYFDLDDPNPRFLATPPTVRVNMSPVMRSSSPQPSQKMRATRQDIDTRPDEEVKIQLLNLPARCMTVDIYNLLHRFGTIIRIDIQPGRRDCIAYVDFRFPPDQALWNKKLKFGDILLGVKLMNRRVFLYQSPIDATKKYKETTTLYADSLDFGFMYDETSMMKMRRVRPCKMDKVELCLNLRRKELDIRFPLIVEPSKQGSAASALNAEFGHYRFRLPISQLQRIYETAYTTGDGIEKRAWVIPFDAAPQFFKQTREIQSTHDTHTLWTEWQTWFRQTMVADDETSTAVRVQPLALKDDRAIIDIGRWTTYRFEFTQSNLDQLKFTVFRNILKDHNIPVLSHKIIMRNRAEAEIWTLLEGSTSGNLPEQSALHYLTNNNMIPLDFKVRYQLEVCLSNGCLNEHNISRHFLEQLSTMDPVVAKGILEKVAEQEVRIYNPTSIFDIRAKEDVLNKMPSYCAYTRAVIITPTTMHIATPIVETSNRVVRKYMASQDRFLRVKFTDEKNEGRINSVENNRSDEVFDRVKRALTHGIMVAGRRYEFLAFGNSQFREHGAYFVAANDHLDLIRMRQWMGSFDHIKVVAKYAARIGQCFSTTRAINSVTVKLLEISDITRNGYTFTDGVGQISEFLAKMIAQNLGLPWDDFPSLFQFRLAGCKGVLAVCPRLKGTEIGIRPSQLKFNAEHRGLEIIRCSSFAVACFNRQLIIVLSTLGVPDDVFLRKQQEMVNDLEEATTVENKALQKLQRNVDMNQMTLTMAAMILDGFMQIKEPFMMSLLQLWRAYNIKFLKEKARIVIDKGAFLLGCVDETATLRGHFDDPQSRADASREEKLATLPEIFLQIPDPEKRGSYMIIEGICILARNPSLHPGDLRVVRAVNQPALHHLKNVVVLPQTGDRDVGNMCSGGDLDGDDYLVLWDMDFLPPEINHPAMDFTPEKPPEITGKVTVDDITTFFVTYMKNDSLGRIATAHLAFADWSESGVCNAKCLELARLHSCAVDYVKTGLPAVRPRELIPRKYPHFLESRNRPPEKIYKSQKVLGQLYDQVQLVDFKPQYELPFDKRILDAFELNEDILFHAREVKKLYDSSVLRLMAKHGIKTEFEVWSTFALEHNQESRDYSFGEELGRLSTAIKDQFKDICREKSGLKAQSIPMTAEESHQLHRFIAAMYTVTAQEMAKALEECRTMKKVAGRDRPVRTMDPKNMPLMSFPWIFFKELGTIATGRSAGHDTAGLTKQGLVKKAHKKPIELAGPGPGAIETKRGLTKIGEILELFKQQPTPPATEEHIAMVERGIQGPAPEKRRASAPFIDNQTVQDDYLAEGKALCEQEQDELRKEEDEDEDEDGEDEGEEVVIDMGKPSALQALQKVIGK